MQIFCIPSREKNSHTPCPVTPAVQILSTHKEKMKSCILIRQASVRNIASGRAVRARIQSPGAAAFGLNTRPLSTLPYHAVTTTDSHIPSKDVLISGASVGGLTLGTLHAKRMWQTVGVNKYLFIDAFFL